jgi:ubiquinone/menaquinone biosynthesis C-methylase UbiE
MPKFTDQNYLVQHQYKDSSNLNARMALHKRFSTNSYGWFDWVFDQFSSLTENANVLEIGCGTGELWKECASRIPEGWTLTLTDLSDGMLDSAWRNLIVIKRGIKFEKMDAQSIPYADGTCDAVIANHMLYHVPDRRQALKEIWRVLKDDGVLFASTLGKNYMHEMWGLLERAGNVKRHLVTAAFDLENGKEQLQEFFTRVELFHYIDNLRVTDVPAMMTYIRSMSSTADFSEDVFQSVERELMETIQKNGEFFVEKDAVLFKALK